MAEKRNRKTIGSILAATADSDILAVIPTLYWRESAQPYASFSKKLRAIKPKETKITCRLKRGYSEDKKPQPLVKVVGIREGDSTEWAIEFEPWAEWLSMVVDCPPSLELSDAEILANIFYEMTFAGFNETKIKRKKDEIYKIAETARKSLSGGSQRRS